MAEVIKHENLSLYEDGKLARAEYLNKPLNELLENDKAIQSSMNSLFNNLLNKITAQGAQISLLKQDNVTKTYVDNAVQDLNRKVEENEESSRTNFNTLLKDITSIQAQVSVVKKEAEKVVFRKDNVLTRGDGGQLTVENALLLNGFNVSQLKNVQAIAFLSAPHSNISYGKNNWYFFSSFIDGKRITGSSEYFEPIKNGNLFTGVRVKKRGIYELWYVQRGEGNDNAQYGVVTINGNRATLENRYGDHNGPWIHDHSGGALSYTKSWFFGELKPGEIVSGGAAEKKDHYLRWGAQAYNGQVCVRLIKEL